ncbi:hypothetical protein [Rhodanobacter spathiphylli]|nr:hypothetical protein [Rhodanobacter spathiphylli]
MGSPLIARATLSYLLPLPALGRATWSRIRFAGWMKPRFGPYLPSLAFAAAFVAVWWLIVQAMDRRHIHLKL